MNDAAHDNNNKARERQESKGGRDSPPILKEVRATLLQSIRGKSLTKMFGVGSTKCMGGPRGGEQPFCPTPWAGDRITKWRWLLSGS